MGEILQWINDRLPFAMASGTSSGCRQQAQA